MSTEEKKKDNRKESLGKIEGKSREIKGNRGNREQLACCTVVSLQKA